MGTPKVSEETAGQRGSMGHDDGKEGAEAVATAAKAAAAAVAARGRRSKGPRTSVSSNLVIPIVETAKR
jgi:hypothetical protein